MRKTLFCGVDLHSDNAMYVITSGRDRQLLARRLPNQLPLVLESLEPFRPSRGYQSLVLDFMSGLLDNGFRHRIAEMPRIW